MRTFLISCVIGLVVYAAGLVYVASHFIYKFW